MIVDVIIEIPKRTNYKYEINKETGRLVLDRVLSTQYPENYGFIRGTLAADDDALDIFVISDHPIVTLSLVKCQILGVYKCLDHDQEDDKVIGFIQGDEYNHIEIEPMWIRAFLETYKKDFKVLKYLGREEAEKVYEKNKLKFWDPNENRVK